MSHKLLVPAFAVAIIGSTLLTVPYAYAQGQQTTQEENFFGNLLNRFTRLFGLNKNQEQALPSTDMMNPSGTPMSTPSQMPSFPDGSNRVATNEDRLSALVKTGKITETQKTAILAELSVIQTKMKALQDELKAWAKAQGIDESYVTQDSGGAMMNNGIPNGLQQGTGQNVPNGIRQGSARPPMGNSPTGTETQ
jgi:hypothetical protein